MCIANRKAHSEFYLQERIDWLKIVIGMIDQLLVQSMKKENKFWQARNKFIFVAFQKCRVGQSAKTPPFHGGMTGSIPVRGTFSPYCKEQINLTFRLFYSLII